MAKDSIFYSSKTLLQGQDLFSLDQPVIMGILNCTPDSFFENSRVNTDTILEKAGQMLSEGARILDVGGYSTRPGSAAIPVEEELKRVIPAISSLRKAFPEALISIDTFRAEVAKAAVESGASMINDIGGGTLDNEMFRIVAELKVPYILSHIQGNLATMQEHPIYTDVVGEIIFQLSEKIQQLHKMGVHDIVLDPGIGFGKTIAHNFEILNHLDYFKVLNCPLLIGISRKSFIYKTLNGTPEESLNATSALHLHCLQKGANILRVHDVKEAVQVLRIYQELIG